MHARTGRRVGANLTPDGAMNWGISPHPVPLPMGEGTPEQPLRAPWRFRPVALAALFAVSPAAAQNWEPAAFTSPWKADTVAAAPAPLGFEPAPGVTFVPSAFSEIGYDTNPSQTFADAKG